jgi:TonB family protein
VKTKLLLLFLLLLVLLSCDDDKKTEIVNLQDLKESDLKQYNTVPHLLMNTRREYEAIFTKIENKIKAAGLKIFPDTRNLIVVEIDKSGHFNKVLILDGEENIIKIVTEELSKNTNPLLDKNKIPGSFQFTFWFDKTDRLLFEKGMQGYGVLDSLAMPIGGMYSIQKKIRYPESAKNNGIQGGVLVAVEIDKNGNVINTEILEGIYPECDEEATNAIKKVKFRPAYKDGVPVKSEVVIPIKFKLQ